MPREYKNYLDLHSHSEGNERRAEMLSEVLKSGAFLPNTVEYQDIDADFKRWAESLTIVSDDGKEFPTMVLFSNQRFSEYTQSWQFTDEKNNLLLNFKTITRDTNPQNGQIHSNFWNIPGKDRFYTMKKQVVLDDNGSESFLVLQMRQPTSIDLIYHFSIFTTQLHSLNEFNTKINQEFNARQCYLKPNGHYMPMTLEGISDASSYSIDDRQFYGQTYQIKVMSYIITKYDYRVSEVPLKKQISMTDSLRKKADVEFEECADGENFFLTITFPKNIGKTSVSFTIDTDIIIDNYTLENLFNNFKVFVNDELITNPKNFKLREGDEIKIIVSKQIKEEEAVLRFSGKLERYKYVIYFGYYPVITKDGGEIDNSYDYVKAITDYILNYCNTIFQEFDLSHVITTHNGDNIIIPLEYEEFPSYISVEEYNKLADKHNKCCILVVDEETYNNRKIEVYDYTLEQALPSSTENLLYMFKPIKSIIINHHKYIILTTLDTMFAYSPINTDKVLSSIIVKFKE